MPRVDSYPVVTAELVHEIIGIDKNPLNTSFEDTITMTLASVKDTIFGEPTQVADHTLGANAEAVNVVFGTSATPPAANTVPQGTIYIQYIP